MTRRSPAYPICMIGFILLAYSGCAWAEALIQVEPSVSFIGSYCTLIPERTEFAGTETNLQVLSTEDDWTLFLTLTETIRRVSDGQELPLHRIQEFFPDYIPEQIITFQPYPLVEGSADSTAHTETFPWLPLQFALSDFLEETDPPGLYRTHLRFDLLNEQGEPLCQPTQISVEFEITEAATVNLSHEETTVEVHFDRSDYGHGESLVTEVVVRSNSDWTLTFRSMANNLIGDHGHLPLEALMLRVEDAPDFEWTSWLPDFVPVSAEPLLVASGEQPLSFSLTEARVPIVFSSDVPIQYFSGRYELPFEVKVIARDVIAHP